MLPKDIERRQLWSKSFHQNLLIPEKQSCEIEPTHNWHVLGSIISSNKIEFVPMFDCYILSLE